VQVYQDAYTSINVRMGYADRRRGQTVRRQDDPMGTVGTGNSRNSKTGRPVVNKMWKRDGRKKVK